MSKLDDEIYNPKRSESIVPLYWEICKICKVPFKTCVFSKTCERCSVLLDERVRLFHSLLLRGFLFIIVYIGISLYWILYIIKYYIEHEDLRNQIGKCGREYALKYHTFSNRLDEIMERL